GAAVAKRAAGPIRVVRSRKGRRLRIDIHCHYLNQAVAAKVAHLDPAQHDTSVQFANVLTRAVNVKQIRDRGPKLSTIETRLKDMERMGIDIQAVSPAPNQTYYWTEADLGAELARLDHAQRTRADCRTVIKKAPSSYLKKMYFDTISFDPRMLRQMVDQYGPGHVLLGTDYPYDMGEEDPVGLIGRVPGLKRVERD